MKEGFSLYIHWPFCLSKCPYCAFNSFPIPASFNEKEFEEAFVKEIHRAYKNTNYHYVKSIYFGGGTPSLMSSNLVEKIINTTLKLWQFSSTCEITLEANPSSIDIQSFKDFKKIGINRLSLGVQALNDKDLKLLGRRHSLKDAYKAIALAISIYNNISLDFIYARPSQTFHSWAKELLEIASINTQHISLYCLTIEKGTPYFNTFKEKIVNKQETKMFLHTIETLEKNGFEAYEISNFAKQGFQSIHNLNYWNYGDYIGIGPGAHGRIKINGVKYATTQEKNLKNGYLL
ncbi:MAG: radical SAM family heme chaperone HemW [Alphaproteobacteria bacterium]